MGKKGFILFLSLIISFSGVAQEVDSTGVVSSKIENNAEEDVEAEKSYKVGDKIRNGKDLFFITQNSPNPFTSFTSINYHLTIEADEIKIMFYGKDNALYRTINLNGKDLHGSLILSRDMFEAGKYTYVFVVNGEMIKSKIMVVKD